MPLWQYRTAPAANGVDAQRLKTNPSQGKNGERKEKREGKVERQEEVKKTMAGLYFIVSKGYLSQWSHCQAPCLYIHGGNQTHAKLVYGHGRGEMAHHEVTQIDCRQSEKHGCVVSSPAKQLLVADILYTEDQFILDSDYTMFCLLQWSLGQIRWLDESVLYIAIFHDVSGKTLGSDFSEQECKQTMTVHKILAALCFEKTEKERKKERG